MLKLHDLSLDKRFTVKKARKLGFYVGKFDWRVPELLQVNCFWDYRKFVFSSSV